MADTTLAVPSGYFDPAKPFLVFPTVNQTYRWQIFDTRNGSRPISRHKYLELAILEAEQLNRNAAKERAAKVLPFPQPVLTFCSYDNGYSPDCTEVATVSLRETEQEVCEYHYRKALKGE